MVQDADVITADHQQKVIGYIAYQTIKQCHFMLFGDLGVIPIFLALSNEISRTADKISTNNRASRGSSAVICAKSALVYKLNTASDSLHIN